MNFTGHVVVFVVCAAAFQLYSSHSLWRAAAKAEEVHLDDNPSTGDLATSATSPELRIRLSFGLDSA